MALTDRRVVVAEANAFTQRGEIGRSIPLNHIRYVRLATASDANERSAIDVITRDENIQWLFHPDAENGHVAAIAALLAESMAIPQEERDALLLRHSPAALPPTDRSWPDTRSWPHLNWIEAPASPVTHSRRQPRSARASASPRMALPEGNQQALQNQLRQHLGLPIEHSEGWYSSFSGCLSGTVEALAGGLCRRW